jgi:hypothetical protein
MVNATPRPSAVRIRNVQAGRILGAKSRGVTHRGARPVRRGQQQSLPNVDSLIRRWYAYRRERQGSTGCNRELIRRGYYVSSRRGLRRLERGFKQDVPDLTKELVAVLLCQRETRHRRLAAAYLLAWHNRCSRRGVLLALLAALRDPWHGLHNAVGRSLFPQLIRRRTGLAGVLALLGHDSHLCRNKGAGILAFQRLRRLDRELIKRQAGGVLSAMLFCDHHRYCRRAAGLLCLKLLGITPTQESNQRLRHR